MARSMMALKPQALSAASSLSALSVVTTHALFALAKIVAIRASSQRFRSMTTVCARMPRDVGTEPELRTPGAGLCGGNSAGPQQIYANFKGIVYVDISEFESTCPSYPDASDVEDPK
jgi:hypothetical protein